MATTMKSDLIVPEVFADLIETKLGEKITLLPLAVQDNTLAGQPGDTLNFPAFRYIGKADEIAENGQVVPNKLASYQVSATVKKYAKAVQITDEARLSGFGDPLGEAAAQLAHSIDHAVDDALFAQLAGVPFSRFALIPDLSADSVADALTLFGEDLEGPAVILVDPAGFAALRKDPDYIRSSDLGQRAIFSGVVGEIWGCQIIVSQKIKADATNLETRYYILKPGALRLVNKQGTFLEVQRDPEYMRDNIFASKHCAAYLYDDSKAIAAIVTTGVKAIMGGAAGQIRTVPAAGSGNFSVIIPESYRPSAPYKWVYTLSASTTYSPTHGTPITGATAWESDTTVIAAGANVYIHLSLVDGENKPHKRCVMQINKTA